MSVDGQTNTRIQTSSHNTATQHYQDFTTEEKRAFRPF